jgi:hypothetical protein
MVLVLQALLVLQASKAFKVFRASKVFRAFKALLELLVPGLPEVLTTVLRALLPLLLMMIT